MRTSRQEKDTGRPNRMPLAFLLSYNKTKGMEVMRKIISLLLVWAMCLTVAGCSSQAKETQAAETNQTPEETSQETVEMVGGETTADKEMDSVGPNGLKAVAVGEAFQVDAKYGSYLITITGIDKTDWWERKYNNQKKSVILLNYEVENINFSSILSEGVKVEYDLFKILDSKKGTLDPFLWYFDDISEAGTVKPGEKASGSIPYVVERDSEYFDVIFTRVTGDVAEVRVDM